MPSLAELQVDFRRFIVGHGVLERGLSGVAGDGLDPAARLSIYRNNILISLTKVLAATFPVVARLVDRRFFDYAADTFIRESLPKSRCLSDYGGNFPTFLSSFTPAAGLAYLPDVAELEWRISRARCAEPLPPLSASALLEVAECDLGRVVFQLQPTSGHVSSRFPVDSIWIDNQPEASPSALSLRPSAVHLEVRAHPRITLRRLDPAVWHFRARAESGAALLDALEAALQISSEFNPGQALAALFQEGCVIGIFG